MRAYTPMMPNKAPNAIDRLVGSRVRQQRLARDVSLERLAQALGVTAPQFMKYEKGLNRIGAGRLHEIAGLLGVPITFFFEAHALAGANAAPVASQAAAQPGPDPSVFADRQTIELAQAFSRIQNPQMRRALIAMARTAASEAGSSGPNGDQVPEASARGRLVRLRHAWPGRRPALEPAAADPGLQARA